MRNKTYSVWSLSDDDGIRYVGSSARPAKGNPHAALKLWQNRYATDTPLNQWLKSLPEQPVFKTLAAGLSRISATRLLAIERRRLKAENCDLLSTRPAGTFETGGGLARPVVADNGDLYLSVRDAARDLGLNASTIQRRIRKGVWRYV